jgi:hypothetical protein
MNKYDYTAKDLCKAPKESISDMALATVSLIAFLIIVALGV